ncbi:uncharacterized protein LOC131157682 [Malania oleifera]|uniref:uncharacterized protein LOC131157682 n=1 Tax=Malania oleifera TaxID=397392 RepID=UPI0025AE73A8|nr:uncharacterized protein LOC131157682 [Malania oleifera]
MKNGTNINAIAKSVTPSVNTSGVFVTLTPLSLHFVQINLIQPNAEAGNDLQLRQRINQRCVGTRRRVSDYGPDGVGVALQELGLLGIRLESKEIEALLKLVFKLYVLWNCGVAGGQVSDVERGGIAKRWSQCSSS